MKETEENANKWKDILYLCFGRINIGKMSILQEIYKIQCNPYQNFNRIFTEMEQS